MLRGIHNLHIKRVNVSNEHEHEGTIVQMLQSLGKLKIKILKLHL